jgi:ribosomal protein S6--L-glutamate ligase
MAGQHYTRAAGAVPRPRSGQAGKAPQSSVPAPEAVAPGDPSSRELRVAVLVERRYLAQPQPAGLSRLLRSRGFEVDVLVPGDETAVRNLPDRWHRYDAVVARGRSPELLDLLAGAERAGVPTVNGAASVRRVLDKGSMGAALAEAGVPVPWTYTGPLDALPPGAVHRFPLICKPVTGDNARGIRVVESPAELAGLDWPEPLAVVQELLPSDGYDLKLYGIGRSVWAVRRRSPLLPADSATPVAVPASPALRALAHRCALLFGLGLYGIDCIDGPRGPVVIEVNDFPNYVGVPDSDELLARHVIRTAVAARRFERTAQCA